MLKASYFTYVGFNATQEASQKTRNIVQVIEFAILNTLRKDTSDSKGDRGQRQKSYQREIIRTCIATLETW